MTDKLKQIEQAVIEYHQALRRREHGLIAGSRCIGKIENILDIQFEQEPACINSQNQSPPKSV